MAPTNRQHRSQWSARGGRSFGVCASTNGADTTNLRSADNAAQSVSYRERQKDLGWKARLFFTDAAAVWRWISGTKRRDFGAPFVPCSLAEAVRSSSYQASFQNAATLITAAVCCISCHHCHLLHPGSPVPGCSGTARNRPDSQKT